MPAEKVRNLLLLGSSVAKILEVTEERYVDFTTSSKRKREITMCAGYIAVPVTYCYGFAAAMRGCGLTQTGFEGVLELGRLHLEMKSPISLFRCWEGPRERTGIECMCFV